MCGVFGVATSRNRKLAIDSPLMQSMRDLLAHRGPDDAGLIHEGHISLAHRRLTLLDREGGAQPFRLARRGMPRVLLAWNGEIYNHLELRTELARDGCAFGTRSDTETLAVLLAMRGRAGLEKLRGMFAISAWFPDTERLLLARDSFGIVPLFHTRIKHSDGDEIAFASEPAPLLANPNFKVEPDWCSVASYLEMPRRTFGARTLYRGLSMIEPGRVHEFDLARDDLRETVTHFAPRTTCDDPIDEHDATWMVRESVTKSIELHMIADAPICTLLSGGIDSTVIASVARAHSKSLVTFAAGATTDAARPGSDLFMARRVASLLGSDHHEILVDRELFASRWDQLLRNGLMPLATPNEIAIALLGEHIAPHAKAALGGEGADELFGGYGAPLEATIAWTEADISRTPASATDFYRTAFGWSPRSLIPELFTEGVGSLINSQGHDPLGSLLHQHFSAARDLSSLASHLEVQRAVNLTNLLERLNLSLMRNGVEGRVPFADVAVLDVARRVGTSHLFGGVGNCAVTDICPQGGVATAAGTLVTKRVLRHAFADVLSPEIASRPKASFPLPFEQWIADASGWIDGPVSREVFSPAARVLVANQASQHWRLAWPMLNIARWLDTVFG